MIGIESTARPRPLGNLFAKHGDVARGGHPNSDLSAPNFENRYCDVLSDGHRLCRPAGQNQHDPLPPDAMCIHLMKKDIVVSGHCCVQGSNLVMCAQGRPCKNSVLRFGSAAKSGTCPKRRWRTRPECTSTRSRNSRGAKPTVKC